MEGIAVEKKQLLQLWKNSLIAMEKKDETLRLKEEATARVRESLIVMDAEGKIIFICIFYIIVYYISSIIFFGFK